MARRIHAPCAKVATMQLSMTVASDFREMEAQVLGDYLLLWIGPSVGA